LLPHQPSAFAASDDGMSWNAAHTALGTTHHSGARVNDESTITHALLFHVYANQMVKDVAFLPLATLTE
jgi:hypothetical protein